MLEVILLEEKGAFASGALLVIVLFLLVVYCHLFWSLSGGNSQPNHNNNGCSNDTGDSSLTINIKTTPTSTKHVT